VEIAMRQITFACQPSFEKFSRASRRAQFLNTMETVVPWSELEALIEPYYRKAGKGRQPVGLGIMLWVYFLQHWFNLSDPGAEDALYDSPALRGFAGVDLGRAAAPDESTILNFRHLLEAHDLCGKIVDATIIPAPSSTKNEKKERDPEMHQTKKGNQYYFGARAHIGVDSKEGIVHSVCTSAASVHDKHMLPDLLHGEENKVWGDGGYQGQTKVIHEAAPKAQEMTNRRVKSKQGVDEQQKRRNRTKSRVRAKVEWPFRILKRVFGYTKVRYRGIVKNHHWHLAAFTLVNLYQHRKRLVPRGA
jgi:IS5 family transposase